MRVLKVKVISLPYIFQVLYVLCFTRPRYQVRVYRTIGHLVNWIFFILAGNEDNYKSMDEFEFGQNSALTSELVALERLKKCHIILLAL